jgi:hypothetical protein
VQAPRHAAAPSLARPLAAAAAAAALCAAGAVATVGLVPPDLLAGDLTAPATAGYQLFGEPGVVAVATTALVSLLFAARDGIPAATAWARECSTKGPPGAIAPAGRAPGILSAAVVIGAVLALDPLALARQSSASFALVGGQSCHCLLAFS